MILYLLVITGAILTEVFQFLELSSSSHVYIDSLYWQDQQTSFYIFPARTCISFVSSQFAVEDELLQCILISALDLCLRHPPEIQPIRSLDYFITYFFFFLSDEPDIFYMCTTPTQDNQFGLQIFSRTGPR